MKPKTANILLILSLLLHVITLTLLLPSCSAGPGTGTGTLPTIAPTIAPPNLRIPASNVLFRPLNAAQAADDGVNTDIKVYADQVVLDNTGTSLQATDVQSAFQETQPDLATILPGTWQTKYFNGNQLLVGTVTFNTDGTWSCDLKGAAFLSVNSSDHHPAVCKTYSVDNDNVIRIVFDWYNCNQPDVYELIENEVRYIPVINIKSDSKLIMSENKMAQKLSGN